MLTEMDQRRMVDTPKRFLQDYKLPSFEPPPSPATSGTSELDSEHDTMDSGRASEIECSPKIAHHSRVRKWKDGVKSNAAASTDHSNGVVTAGLPRVGNKLLIDETILRTVLRFARDAKISLKEKEETIQRLQSSKIAAESEYDKKLRNVAQTLGKLRCQQCGNHIVQKSKLPQTKPVDVSKDPSEPKTAESNIVILRKPEVESNLPKGLMSDESTCIARQSNQDIVDENSQPEHNMVTSIPTEISKSVNHDLDSANEHPVYATVNKELKTSTTGRDSPKYVQTTTETQSNNVTNSPNAERKLTAFEEAQALSEISQEDTSDNQASEEKMYGNQGISDYHSSNGGYYIGSSIRNKPLLTERLSLGTEKSTKKTSSITRRLDNKTALFVAKFKRKLKPKLSHADSTESLQSRTSSISSTSNQNNSQSVVGNHDIDGSNNNLIGVPLTRKKSLVSTKVQSVTPLLPPTSCNSKKYKAPLMPSQQAIDKLRKKTSLSGSLSGPSGSFYSTVDNSEEPNKYQHIEPRCNRDSNTVPGYEQLNFKTPPSPNPYSSPSSSPILPHRSYTPPIPPPLYETPQHYRIPLKKPAHCSASSSAGIRTPDQRSLSSASELSFSRHSSCSDESRISTNFSLGDIEFNENDLTLPQVVSNQLYIPATPQQLSPMPSPISKQKAERKDSWDRVSYENEVFSTSSNREILYDVEREQEELRRLESGGIASQWQQKDDPPPKPSRPGFSNAGNRGYNQPPPGPSIYQPTGPQMYPHGRSNMPMVPPKGGPKIMTAEEIQDREARERLDKLHLDTKSLNDELEHQKLQSEADDAWIQQEEENLNPENVPSIEDENDPQHLYSSPDEIRERKPGLPTKPPRKPPVKEVPIPPMPKTSLQEVKPTPTMKLDRSNDKVYQDTMSVVKCVLQANQETMTSQPDELFVLVKNIAKALKELCTSLDQEMPNLPDQFHREIDMAQKTTNKDLSQIINQMKLVKRFYATTQVTDYKKCMMAATQVLAMDVKNLLDAVDKARLSDPPSSSSHPDSNGRTPGTSTSSVDSSDFPSPPPSLPEES